MRVPVRGQVMERGKEYPRRQRSKQTKLAEPASSYYRQVCDRVHAELGQYSVAHPNSCRHRLPTPSA